MHHQHNWVAEREGWNNVLLQIESPIRDKREVSLRLVVGERLVHGRARRVGCGRSGNIYLLQKKETVIGDGQVLVTVLSRALEFGGWPME